MADDDSSGLSSLGSDIEDPTLDSKRGILKFFTKIPKSKQKITKVGRSPSLSPPPREPSPSHEYVLADNPDIAFAVMFRSRFTIAFPKSVPHFGPQELERAVVLPAPGDTAVQFLCGLLSLLLNRKQDVKSDHYNRALEEAISTHKQQWARDWQERNPVAGKASFETMTPVERLTLLKTLIIWTLSSSQVVRDIIASSYKQNRHEDDLNQPLSIQPWGQDSYRKKYYLIEGIDDTNFRVYKESEGLEERSWWSVAGNIDELVMLADKLSTDGGQKARVLALKMRNAIPRFEATEEKRKRREYRQSRKEQFKRPEPGFGSYEGRTRGKRMRYTFSDQEEDVHSDATSRRSKRNTGSDTPAEDGPLVTQSGRQIRVRAGGAYGGSITSNIHDTEGPHQDENGIYARPRRLANAHHRIGTRSDIDMYISSDDMNDHTEHSEPDYGDDEEDEHISEGSEEDEFDGLDIEDNDNITNAEAEELKTLIVRLPVKRFLSQNHASKEFESMQTDEPPDMNVLTKHGNPTQYHATSIETDGASTASSSIPA